MTYLLKLILGITLVIIMLVLGPWIFIWAINTLAHTGGAIAFTVPFTFWTWLAALLIGGRSISSLITRK